MAHFVFLCDFFYCGEHPSVNSAKVDYKLIPSRPWRQQTKVTIPFWQFKHNSHSESHSNSTLSLLFMGNNPNTICLIPIVILSSFQCFAVLLFYFNNVTEISKQAEMHLSSQYILGEVQRIVETLEEKKKF